MFSPEAGSEKERERERKREKAKREERGGGEDGEREREQKQFEITQQSGSVRDGRRRKSAFSLAALPTHHMSLSIMTGKSREDDG